MTRRTLLYLYGTPNIVGSILGLVGLTLFFTGVIQSYWLPIVAGLYALGAVAIPQRRAESLTLENEFSEEALRNGLERLLRKVRPRLSKPVLEHLHSIKETLMALIPRLGEMDGAARHLHVVRQTATTYLPEMLENYLKLPPAFARFHPVKDGKTARDILVRQLEVLDRELKRILTDVYRNDTDALLAHGRFLEAKFATGAEWLK